MRKYLVGINGSNTPDPAYWRARNAFIEAKSAEEAKEKWIQARTGWLRADEIPFIRTRDASAVEQLVPASDYVFTPEGFEQV